MKTDTLPAGFSKDFLLVGYHDLDGKTGFKLAMTQVADRWYLYLCHHRAGGWAVLDVTDPARPEKALDLPFSPSVMTNQIQVADKLMLTPLQHFHDGAVRPSDPADEGILIWDLSDPAAPRRIGHWRTGAYGCHRIYYEGGRYVHATASRLGQAGQSYAIVDIIDPENPVEASRWSLGEQALTGQQATFAPYQHAVHVAGDRAYLAYGQAGMVILDISDVKAPKFVSRLQFMPGFGDGTGCHTVVPIPERGIALVTTEPLDEDSGGAFALACIVDISNERAPRVISVLPAPAPPAGAPYKSFGRRGGRFAPHNLHQHQNQPHLFRSDQLAFLTWYGAGLRAYDISDAYCPRETGFFQPQDPVTRRHPHPTNLVFQGSDIVMDARGYIYMTEMNSGLYVVRYTGEGSPMLGKAGLGA